MPFLASGDLWLPPPAFIPAGGGAVSRTDGDTVVDLFSGGGGWEQGARTRGLDIAFRSIGMDSSDTAVATARLAGHTSHPADVAHILPWHYTGIVGLIASPPCQTFSVSGAGAGRRDLDLVLAVVREVAHGEVVDPDWFEDPRTALVVEPLRWALACRPEWVALEQVPSVRPVWEAIAHELRRVGYSVAVGIVKAEQHGVAQTRRRAVLVASRVKRARLPAASFQEFRMEHLRPDLPRWFSMAEVLGWGATGRPSMTVTGGGSDTGGAEPFGTGAREGLRREQEAGRWIMRSNYKDGDRPDLRALRSLDEPSVTLTGRPPQWAMETANGPAVTYRDEDEPAATLTGRAGSLVFRNTNRENACERTLDEPAGVIYGGNAASGGEWALRSSVSDAGYAKTIPRHLDEPAATITSKHRSADWVLEHSRAPGTSYYVPRSGDEPASTITSNSRSDDWVKGDGDYRQRISVSEASVLQSFPPDYPWQGTRSRQYLHVGNAIPPLMAGAILEEIATDGP